MREATFDELEDGEFYWMDDGMCLDEPEVVAAARIGDVRLVYITGWEAPAISVNPNHGPEERERIKGVRFWGPIPHPPFEDVSSKDEAPHGYCPRCGAPGIARERRLNGNDICSNRHSYPSAEALGTRPLSVPARAREPLERTVR